nr:C25 family peptidase propeptide domain-containing protein [bacterium]
MKNAFLMVLATCLVMLAVSPAGAEWISLTGAREGATPEVSLAGSDSGGVTVTVDVPGIYVMEEEMEGMVFHAVRIPEAGRSLDVGFPEVPKIQVSIAVPATGRVAVREVGRTSQTLDGYIVSPMQHATTDIDPVPEFVINEKAYSSGMYPPAGVSMHAPAIRRDVRFVQVDVYPVIARASEVMMDVATQVTFEVKFSDGVGINEKTREVGLISPELDNMYRKSYLNYDALGYDVGESRDSNIRYLIITADSHAASIQPLADWWNRT